MGNYRIQPEGIPDINIPAKEVKRILKGIEDMKRYTPNLEAFAAFMNYTLAHPGEKLTYEGFQVHKMKKMLEREGGEGSLGCGTKS